MSSVPTLSAVSVFVARGRSKACLHSAGRDSESNEIKQLPALFVGHLNSFAIVCKMMCKYTPQKIKLCILFLVSCRFDSIFEEKFENVAMASLKLNRK